MIFRLVSAANERGDFRPQRLQCTTSERHGFAKTGESGSLFKIPPLACGQSAPFDKGVNQAALQSEQLIMIKLRFYPLSLKELPKKYDHAYPADPERLPLLPHNHRIQCQPALALRQ